MSFTESGNDFIVDGGGCSPVLVPSGYCFLTAGVDLQRWKGTGLSVDAVRVSPYEFQLFSRRGQHTLPPLTSQAARAVVRRDSCKRAHRR